MKRIVSVLLAVLFLGGCASFGKPEKEKAPPTVEEMYAEAKDQLVSGNYSSAVKAYEALQARYPYGRYAQQAELEIAYANFKDQEPTLALAAIDRFIKQHPAHPNVDYAYYLKGLINFIEDRTLFAAIVKSDMSERDPKAARESFEAFRELVTRFPNSRYAEDARDRMAFLVTALADNDLHVARYYYRRGAYLAAANRAKAVIETYPQTNRIETALYIMAAAYDKLGQVELRDDTRRVLAQNFPASTLNDEKVFGERAWWRIW
jgi:outer membrane protein assembly factor BamD